MLLKRMLKRQKGQTLHQWQSMMIWVRRSLNRQTAIQTPQKKSKKAQDQVNAKAQDGDANDETPDTEKGVTKVSTPGQKETIKAQKDHEKINADAKTMADTYGMGEKKHMKEKAHMKKEEVEEDLIDVSADVDALVKDGPI